VVVVEVDEIEINQKNIHLVKQFYHKVQKNKYKENDNIQQSDSLGTLNYEVVQHQMIQVSF
jgi:hypothetical protein